MRRETPIAEIGRVSLPDAAIIPAFCCYLYVLPRAALLPPETKRGN